VERAANTIPIVLQQLETSHAVAGTLEREGQEDIVVILYGQNI
jgi:hypothetical protein